MTTFVICRSVLMQHNLTARRRLIVYIYPERHPLYADLAVRFARARAQAGWRIILLLGWREARGLVEAFRSGDTVVIGQWRQRFPVAADGRLFADRGELPIVDRHHRANQKLRYTVYLRPTSPAHAQILAYYDSLPTAELRQLFGRLALVNGAAHPEIDGLVEAVR
jgi:hypothetical protein